MVLDTFSKESENIRTIRVEEHPNSLYQRFKRLKQSFRFDYDSMEWQEESEKKPSTINVNTSTQLLASIVESFFSYNKGLDFFRSIQNISHSAGGLWEVIAKLNFNITSTDQRLEFVKSRLFDKSENKWRTFVMEDNNKNRYFSPENTLLAVIAQSYTDKKLAKETFENATLDNTIYSKVKNAWVRYTHTSTGVNSYTNYTTDQLLSVIAQAQFDADKAMNMYKSLKQSEFFDPVNNFWRERAVFNPGVFGVLKGTEENASTKLHLLDIWANQMLFGKNKDQPTQELPQKRQF